MPALFKEKRWRLENKTVDSLPSTSSSIFYMEQQVPRAIEVPEILGTASPQQKHWG